jgi:hypothetical protein
MEYKEMGLEPIGFWKNPSGTEDGRKEVEAAKSEMSFAELYGVLSYIKASKKGLGYMGWASCRSCGEHLGSFDMLTPDNNFVFPEMYEHYIVEHGVRPPENFMKAAAKWNAKNKPK